MFHETADQLAEEVQARHALRLDGPSSIPMIPRPFTPRLRPKTAIISEAAKRKIEQREMNMGTVLNRALQRWRIPC